MMVSQGLAEFEAEVILKILTRRACILKTYAEQQEKKS